MYIAVIAANGRLGKMFVEEALLAGHTVRAGVRGDANLDSHENLEVVECDATQEDDLIRLLKDQDVVVSALGHVKDSDPDVQTIVIKALIRVMNELHITRFIDVTGTGVRFPDDRIPLIDRVLNLAVTLIDHDRVIDGKKHQDVLISSDLDWTTIRVLKLQNTTPKPYRLTQYGPTKWYVSRREVAKAMLEVIEQNSYVQQAPIISRV